MKKYETILNVGAGKNIPLRLNDYLLVNMDPGYTFETSSISDVYDKVIEKGKDYWKDNNSETMYVRSEWEEFSSKFLGRFDRIVVYRYLEHVAMVQVPYFIYMMSTLLNQNGVFEGIVPDYKKLARLLLKEDPFEANFDQNNILLTTEIVNEPYDPHASVWTEDRIKYFFELEGRFNVKEIVKDFNYDGRDIYIWFQAELKNIIR
jgi:hypothetical protein